jgi:predicted component of type VI protein secretion system
MLVNLITFTKKGGRKDFGVGANKLVIGRRPEADIRIPVGEVSRDHCEIKVQGDKVLVRDLDSSNGTFVNDQRVSEATLKPGDHMRIGPVEFTVQIDGVPAQVKPGGAKSGKPASTNGPTKIAKPAAASPAAAKPAPSKPSTDDDDIDFDIDSLEELNSGDLSDFDIGDVDGELSDSDVVTKKVDDVEEVEEIDEIEEISEDDLVVDDDSDKI